MSFCSGCGLARQAKKLRCHGCNKDFRYITEVNAYPFMLCVRRRLLKCLNSSPVGVVELMEPNISVEVFEELFGKYGKAVDSASPPPSAQHSFESESTGPSTISIASSDSSGPKSTSVQILTRVVWKRWELDAICKFQSIDANRAVGAGVCLPEALGCAVVIPPLHVSHFSYVNGEQRMTVSFSYAFLNAGCKIFQPPDHCLDLAAWGAPPEMGDAQGYIVDTVASYPSELKQNGIQLPDLVLKSASAILSSRAPAADPKIEEQSKKALEQWASKSRQPSVNRLSRSYEGYSSSSASSSIVHSPRERS